MPTTMLLRQHAVSGVKRIISQEPLLPFLYNTHTIRNQHNDALSEFETSSNEQESKPRTRNRADANQHTFRVRPKRQEYENRVRRVESARPRREYSEEEGSEGLHDNPRPQYRRPEREEHIPFEHAAQETMSIRDKIATSTITPLEKKAFENLLSLSQQKAPKDKGRHRDRDRVDDVLMEASLSRAKLAASDGTPMPEVLKKIQDKMQEDRSTAQKVLLEQAVELDLQQVKKDFETAETDIELWKMLHEKVLSRVTQLRLDEPAAPKEPVKQQNQKAKSKGDTAQQSPWKGDISDELVITRTLPQHLVECQRQLLSSFPSSQLHLSLVPYLKSLGPTTFALATSTKLYNQHMRSLFKSQSNLSQIVHTLEEMDKEVYEFDDKTKDLMDSIRKRGSLARKGVHGTGLAALWSGERYGKATRAATFWARSIESRMQEQALREARAKEEDVEL